MAALSWILRQDLSDSELFTDSLFQFLGLTQGRPPKQMGGICWKTLVAADDFLYCKFV
jgi:hypothetical protein